MKNKTSLVFFAVIAFMLLASEASATVGGPTYIDTFKYNNADESVYYTETSFSGKGCPPELKKVSLSTEQVSTVISCSDGEKLAYTLGDASKAVEQEIAGITEAYKLLTPLSLSKNNIEVDIQFAKEEYLESSEFLMRRHFTATVFQNGKKVDQFNLTGCALEQPFIFAGYAIPGFNKKIVILSSAKTDCFEGGYVGESLHVIGGVDGLDKAQVHDVYKAPRTALAPSESTLIVFEKDTVTQKATAQATSTPTKTSNTLPIAVGALILGILVGMVTVKRAK